MGLARIVGAVLAAVLAFVVKTAYDAGEFKTLEPHGNEECFLVKGAVGVEDLDVSDGHVLGTTDDRKWMKVGAAGGGSGAAIAAQAAQGGLVELVDAAGAAPRLRALELVGFAGPDFHPHGLKAANDGSGRVWVVNHARDGDRLEAFDVDAAAGTATHRCSLRGDPDVFRNLNDVTVGPLGELYATNWLHYPSGTPMGAVEMYGQRPWGSVVRCEAPDVAAEGCGAPRCAMAAEGVAMPNGVEVLPGGEQVMVVSTLTPAFQIYDRDAATGALSLASSTGSLASGCDNLWLSPETGRLYAGCHPQMLTFVRHSHNPRGAVAPSQVISIGADGQDVREEMLSYGRDLSASSTAVLAGGRMFVGGVFDDGVLVCPGPA